MSKRMSFSEARSRYVNRFTTEHTPAWARHQRDDGSFYAPQYASDLEWYERTTFPGEPGHLGFGTDCYSQNPSWPLGEALAAPYRGRAW